MENDFEQKFNEQKERAENLYKSIGEIFCPYFRETISFTAKGLEHLKFKSKHQSRLIEDQFVRFKLLHLAPEVIKLSKTIQGIAHTKSFEEIRSNNRTETLLKPVSYYEFIAILENKRVRIVVKQIENGPKYFWSIIPSWKMNKEKGERQMHSQNLESE
jgi:hypothetical protein